MIRKYAEFFCWKNVSSFCSAKATHIFSAKNIRILYIDSTKTVNEMTLNELVKLTTLWTTGPWCCGSYSIHKELCIHKTCSLIWLHMYRLTTISAFWMRAIVRDTIPLHTGHRSSNLSHQVNSSKAWHTDMNLVIKHLYSIHSFRVDPYWQGRAAFASHESVAIPLKMSAYLGQW